MSGPGGQPQSTTTEIYGHLLRHVAHQAVAAIDIALTAAERELPASGDHNATTTIPS